MIWVKIEEKDSLYDNVIIPLTIWSGPMKKQRDWTQPHTLTFIQSVIIRFLSKKYVMLWTIMESPVTF